MPPFRFAESGIAARGIRRISANYRPIRFRRAEFARAEIFLYIRTIW
jgi:hypothetical protein